MCVCVCVCVYTAPGVCVYLDGSNVGQNFTAGYTLCNYVCDEKKNIQNRYLFLQNR